jgi:hypothetical protein
MNPRGFIHSLHIITVICAFTGKHNGCFTTLSYVNTDQKCMFWIVLRTCNAYHTYTEHKSDFNSSKCYICYFSLTHVNELILMHVGEVDYEQNVGDTCKHPANSGEDFTYEGWHLISTWMEAKEIMYCGIFAQGMNCEARHGSLVHNDWKTCNDIITQGAVAARRPANSGRC